MSNEKLKILVSKTTACPVCNSFLYSLPINVNTDLATHLSSIGDPMYPLDKFKIFKIETEAIAINGAVGKHELRVKFKKNAVSMSALFRAALLKWVEASAGPAEFVGIP